MTLLDVLIVALIVAVVVCAALLLSVLVQGARVERAISTQLNALSHTHLQGFEALTITLERLEKRVKEVESALP
jgi:uncharacterized membrane protein YciS (DUF1049 family)